MPVPLSTPAAINSINFCDHFVVFCLFVQTHSNGNSFYYFFVPFYLQTIINMAYCCLILLGKSIQKLVFGELRISEQQHLKDKFWNFVFYKFIFVFGVVNVQFLHEVSSTTSIVVENENSRKRDDDERVMRKKSDNKVNK